MDVVDEFTPEDLEVLPNKIVYDIVQYGITGGSEPREAVDASPAAASPKVKKYSPKNRKFKKEAIASINRVASLFVLYITTIAESIAKSNKRSTVFDKDILQALRQCMFWEVESQITDSEKRDSEAQGSNSLERKPGDDVEMDPVDAEADLGVEDDDIPEYESPVDDLVEDPPEFYQDDEVPDDAANDEDLDPNRADEPVRPTEEEKAMNLE